MAVDVVSNAAHITATVKASRNVLIQMSGAPGAGKSTIARLLGQSVQGVVIDHDVLKSSILETCIISVDQAAKQAYILQWRLAHDIMQQGLSVVIDSPCNYQEILNEGSQLAARHSSTYWYVECVVKDIDLLDQRLRTRNAQLSQRTAIDHPPMAATGVQSLEDATALFTKWINHPCRPVDNVIIVDSTIDPDINRTKILEQINATSSLSCP